MFIYHHIAVETLSNSSITFLGACIANIFYAIQEVFNYLQIVSAIFEALSSSIPSFIEFLVLITTCLKKMASLLY